MVVVVVVVVAGSYAFESQHNYMIELNAQRIQMPSTDITIC